MRYFTIFWLELLQATRDVRAGLVIAVASLFFVVAFTQGNERVGVTASAVAVSTAKNRQAWLAQPPQNPHGAAHFPVLLAKPTAPLASLVAGADGILPGHLVTDAHRLLPAKGTSAADAPFAQAIGTLDTAFVIGVILSLLAVLAGSDLVAGEKERGTLRLTFANPVRRNRWLLAKIAGRTTGFLVAVTLAASLALMIAGGVVLGPSGLYEGMASSAPNDVMGRLGGFLFLSAIYLAVWITIGAACSVFSARVASATLAAVVLWIALVVIAPRAVATIAELGDPIPATSPARMAIRVEEVRLRRQQEAMVETLKASGGLKGAGAITTTEGPAAVRDIIDAAAARAQAKADAPIANWRERQLTKLDAFGCISPTSLYFRIAAGFAGTDGQRHHEFLNQASAWRSAFLERLNRLEDRGIAEFSDYPSVAPFQFKETASQRIWIQQSASVATMLCMWLIILLLCFFRFKHYDLR